MTLVEHLFPPQVRRLPGLEIALAYRQAGNREHVGGDIIDVYRLLNKNTVLSIADISGKGVKAAVDAALIKYSMRAYASEGFRPNTFFDLSTGSTTRKTSTTARNRS